MTLNLIKKLRWRKKGVKIPENQQFSLSLKYSIFLLSLNLVESELFKSDLMGKQEMSRNFALVIKIFPKICCRINLNPVRQPFK